MAATIIIKGIHPRKCPQCKKMTLRYAADVHATEDDHSKEGFAEETTYFWFCTECKYATQGPDKRQEGERTKTIQEGIKRGVWHLRNWGFDYHECSVYKYGHRNPTPLDFCPNCHADMRRDAIPERRIKRAEQVLIDNGIEPDEAETVLQALGYVLLDAELYPEGKEDIYDPLFLVIEKEPCDSETCRYNPNGYCLAQCFTGEPPVITEEGCSVYEPND